MESTSTLTEEGRLTKLNSQLEALILSILPTQEEEDFTQLCI
jgi:hypothetical protein